MRKAQVFMHGIYAGLIEEIVPGQNYTFTYSDNYIGDSISLTISKEKIVHHFKKFPSFFEGLLPEGYQLESLLKERKIDRNDFMAQLMATGSDLVGAVTVKQMDDEL